MQGDVLQATTLSQFDSIAASGQFDVLAATPVAPTNISEMTAQSDMGGAAAAGEPSNMGAGESVFGTDETVAAGKGGKAKKSLLRRATRKVGKMFSSGPKKSAAPAS